MFSICHAAMHGSGESADFGLSKFVKAAPSIAQHALYLLAVISISLTGCSRTGVQSPHPSQSASGTICIAAVTTDAATILGPSSVASSKSSSSTMLDYRVRSPAGISYFSYSVAARNTCPFLRSGRKRQLPRSCAPSRARFVPNCGGKF